MRSRISGWSSLAALALAGVAQRQPATVPPAGSKAPLYRYRVQQVYPHDPNAFTQGLQYADGFLYEGTGLNGRSSIRKVKLETGEIVQQRAVPKEYFGEGIALWKSDLIELTWQSEVAFVYDSRTFELRRTLTYVGEGWGLTHDATSLIMSDGTEALRFLDPMSFAERRRLVVTDAGTPVTHLNELEVVKGEIFANVWLTDYVARVAPDTGRVIGWIDFGGLLSARERATADVLNGIAYDDAHDRLFVTGKLWPKLFELKIVDAR
jgi:glutamine cyclotransferase